MRWLSWRWLGAGLVFACGSQAFGQAGSYHRPITSPYNQPTVSPYLGLARSGNPAVNYYSVVRPQQQFGSSINQLQQKPSSSSASRDSQEGLDQLPDTGHQIQFQSYGRYFQNFQATRSTSGVSDLAVGRSLRQAVIRSTRGPEYPRRQDDR